MSKTYFINRYSAKNIIAFSVTSAIIATSFSPIKAFAASGEITRSERLPQPQITTEFEANELGVVNFTPKWGDKEANTERMEDYIDDAHKKGVKVLLFPEMCVTGYVSSSNPDSESYKWAVESAEPLDGPTQKNFAKISDEYDMWIIYGSTQTIENDSKHAYNSAFICSPDGDVTAYQKITPVEGDWCVAGDTPVIIDTEEYGKLGISICFDTYSTPELERYYAAQGCNVLINPTASGGGWSLGNMNGWQEYYKLRLESIASRDGYTILSSNITGVNMPDGSDKFPGGSVIMQGSFNGAKYFAGEKDSDGKITIDASIITSKEGLLTNSTALIATTGSTCTNADFNPGLYTSLYKELAKKQAASGGSISYSPAKTNGLKAATVNMTGYWGNKAKTKAKMLEYIKEAGEKGVNILVFPETVLTGYGWIEPEQDPFYKKYGVSMQVATAETIPGNTTEELSEYAKKYNMYIIFGMTEKDKDGAMYENGVEKVYNSAAILYPDGKIDSYQKIHRAGLETEWSVCGSTPKIIETKWGPAGIDICRDGHFYPEIGRYYAAMGCVLFLHPTATTGNPWYRATRIGSYTDRDGMAAITCNLLGGDGIYVAPGETFNPLSTDNFDENGNFTGGSKIPGITEYTPDNKSEYWNGDNWLGTGKIFNSTSFIITKGQNGNRLNYNNTGSASEGYEKRTTSPLGLEISDMDLTGCGFNASNSTFRAELYSKMYDKLASMYRKGYKQVYGDNAIANPVTINLSKDTTPNNTNKLPVNGTELTIKNAIYKVIKAGSTVEYVKPTVKKSKSINIPSKVKADGITYKVISISANAFKNNKSIKKITISTNIQKIGSSVFLNCKKLKNITIKSLNINSIGSKAFKGIAPDAVIKVPAKKFAYYKKALKKSGVNSKVLIKKF